MREQRTNNKPNGVPSQVIHPKVSPKKPQDKMHGNKIKAILDEIQMSQEELADIALDGDAPHLSRIINGKKRSISLPTAFKIARTLNRPIEEVFIYRPDEDE